MKAWLAQFKVRHWDSLSAAEKKTVTRGAWTLVPLLMYALLWQPVHHALPALQVALPRLRAQSEQMQMLAEQTQSLRQRAQLAVLDSDALKAIVEKSAQDAGLPLLVTPGELNSVRVSADNLPFASWVQWLRTMQNTQHVRVSSTMLVAKAEAGMVKVQATLTNGADQ